MEIVQVLIYLLQIIFPSQQQMAKAAALQTASSVQRAETPPLTPVSSSQAPPATAAIPPCVITSSLPPPEHRSLAPLAVSSVPRSSAPPLTKHLPALTSSLSSAPQISSTISSPSAVLPQPITTTTSVTITSSTTVASPAATLPTATGSTTTIAASSVSNDTNPSTTAISIVGKATTTIPVKVRPLVGSQLSLPQSMDDLVAGTWIVSELTPSIFPYFHICFCKCIFPNVSKLFFSHSHFPSCCPYP